MMIHGGAWHSALAPATVSQISAEDERVRIERLGHGNRRPVFGSRADAGIKRDLPEKLGPKKLGLRSCAAMTKDLAAVAVMRAQEIDHILDNAEHRHVDLSEHVEPLAGIEHCYVPRGRDDDRTCQGLLLGHRQLRVASAGRHVDDHDVEFATFDLPASAAMPSGHPLSARRFSIILAK